MEIKIPTPTFDSQIIELIMQLEVLRADRVYLDVNPILFHQINKVFHSIESLQSARIEGNRTTLTDYFQAKLDFTHEKNQNIDEIKNIENAIKYIDELFEEDKNLQISHRIIKELHSITTLGLYNEGSRSPGAYRKSNVKIQNSKHTPPELTKVQDYMNEFVNWINLDSKAQVIPLKIAIAHHRFTWIHPFDNGNGRMSRLITYFLLRQFGYKMTHLMNLSAIFCIDRQKYFDMLEKADSENDQDILSWCEYVLSGLSIEIKKMKKLLNKDYFISNIMEPIFDAVKDRGLISEFEYKILRKSLHIYENVIMLKDIKPLFKDKNERQLNFIINQMLERKLLIRTLPKSRKYILQLNNNILMYELIRILEKENFITIK